MEISDIRRGLGLENLDPEDIDRIKLQLQQINDTIQGGLRSANFKVFPAVYVINAEDSLDENFPFYVHFNIIPEMVKIVSIQLSFWFLNFRAYAKSATEKAAVTSGASSASSSASGGGQTPTSGASSASSSGGGGVVSSASGGGETPTSSSVTTPSGGGATSGVVGNSASAALCHTHWIGIIGGGSGKALLIDTSGNVRTAEASPPNARTYDNDVSLDHTHSTPAHTHPAHSHTVTIASHTHVGGTHTHNIEHTHTVTITSHTHNIEHTHTVPAHSHGITYGIFEEENSPTIVPSISRDNGLTYSLPLGSYTTNQELDITRFIDTMGSKIIKFTSNARTRISVQITVKLDVKAR